MLMPKKHIKMSESLFGTGGIILSVLGRDTKTFDEIIYATNSIIDDNKNKKMYNNVDKMLLAIDYLYAIGAVEVDKEGGIYNAIIRT